MRRFIIAVFLLLYFYNFFGYIAVFSFLQYRVRSEVKKMLKESVPTSDLILFAFHTPTLDSNGYSLRWIKSYEFRYAGGLYDVVRSYTGNDTTYFLCLNDSKEERLFENLDNHVRREMGHSGHQGMLDAFKNVFKDSIPPQCEILRNLFVLVSLIPWTAEEYQSIVLDVPSPPPRFL